MLELPASETVNSWMQSLMQLCAAVCFGTVLLIYHRIATSMVPMMDGRVRITPVPRTRV